MSASEQSLVQAAAPPADTLFACHVLRSHNSGTHRTFCRFISNPSFDFVIVKPQVVIELETS
jgi:hypothetical protein